MSDTPRNIEAETLDYIFGKSSQWREILDGKMTPPWPLPHHVEAMGLCHKSERAVPAGLALVSRHALGRCDAALDSFSQAPENYHNSVLRMRDALSGLIASAPVQKAAPNMDDFLAVASALQSQCAAWDGIGALDVKAVWDHLQARLAPQQEPKNG